MRNSRRFVAVGITAALAALTVGGSAGAQTAPLPETFSGSATAQGLELSAFGQGLTLGHSIASGAAPSTATAKGTGQLNPLADSTVSESTAGAAEDAAEACDGFNLSPELEPLGISLAIACGDSAATAAGGLPVASASGWVADIGISVNTLLDTIPVSEPIGDAVDSVFEGLAPVFSLDPALEEVGMTLQDIIGGLLETQTLAVSVGASSSTFTTTAETVVAEGKAAGATIEILPDGAVNLETQATEPVATVFVGAATATATYDRAAGTTATAFEPALVRVVVNETIATALMLPENDIAVAPGVTECIPLPDPLEVCITAAGGEEFKPEAGGIGARSAAVKVHLFTGLGEATGAGEGGLVLSLAETEAVVNGTPAVAPPAEGPQVEDELPRTGGTPVLPLAGAAALLLAVLGGRLVLAGRSD